MFVPTVQINSIPALFEIMVCHLVGAKPLSEPFWLAYWRIYASLGLIVLRYHKSNWQEATDETGKKLFPHKF